MKLAFIVQRYGREILGGSETLARQLAERLSKKHDVTVLTTTAKDYITWKSEYEPGEEKQRGVRIRRFPVEGERDLESFNKFSEEVYGGKATREQELEWLHRQGPVTPELVKYLEKEHHRYDLLVFFTYLYYPTYYGLHVAPEKSLLVPTAHDEPALRLGIFKEMFQLPEAFLFNAEAEEVLVLERFGVHKKMRETIGMGMELLDVPDATEFRKAHDIPAQYLLYAGRIDEGKGLDELFRYFTFYKEENPESGNLELILIGKLGMKLPEDKSIRYVGFVDEGAKLSAMAGATAIVQPSRMESFSIVSLEAFSVGTPVVASAFSRVLVDHCRKANAGFYYGDFEEFEGILKLLLSNDDLRRGLGKNGQRYVKENYGWQKLLAKYELAFRSFARKSRDARPRTADEPRAEEDRRDRGRRRRPERDAQPSAVAAVEESEVAADGGAPSETDAPAAPAARPANRSPERAEASEAHPVDHVEPESETEAEPEAASAPEPEPEEEEEEKTVASERADEPKKRRREPDKPVAASSSTDSDDEESPEAPTESETESPEASASSVPERGESDAPDEPAPEPPPVPKEAAGLPSFFQSSVPPLPEPDPEILEKPRVKRTPKPAPPPPPPEGELPEFFKPRTESEPEASDEAAPAATDPKAPPTDGTDPHAADDATEPGRDEGDDEPAPNKQ